MKTSNVTFIVLVAFAVGLVVGMALQRTYYPCVELPVITVTRDTIIVRDTLRQGVPVPRIEYRTRTDTVTIQISPQDGTGQPVDTTTPQDPRTSDSGPQIDVHLPIVSKVYLTPEYRAVISGFRPSLDSMELYRDTRTVHETITKVQTIRPRWVLVAGGGVGYTPERQVVPVVGLTIGYAIKSW